MLLPPLFLIAALPHQLALTFAMEPGGCALEERLPQSLARYVPRLSLGTAGEGTWRLAVSSRPGEVEIALTDDANAEQLHRVVRAEPEACAAAADGIGLILERYLSDLGYETGFTPLPEIATATIAPEPPIEPPSIVLFVSEPSSYTGTSTVVRLRWETRNADATRLLVDDDLDVAFPGGASGTYTTTITGSAELTLVASNDDDSASAILVVDRRRAVEPVRGIGMYLGAAGVLIGGIGLRAGGLFDVGLEIPVLQLFTAEMRRIGRAEPTLEIATLLVRTELSFFGIADGPGRLAILRNDTVLGEYRVWAIGALANVSGCADIIAIAVCLSAGVGFERAAASAEGARLFDPNRTVSVGALLQFGGQIEVRFGRIRPYFRATLGIRPEPPEFDVMGSETRYEEKRAFGFAGLGIAVQLF
jgi:hypothetical protein